jgi:hypothetical protein
MRRKVQTVGVLQAHLNWLKKSQYKTDIDLDEFIKEWDAPKSNIISKLYEDFVMNEIVFKENDESIEVMDIYKDYLKKINDVKKIKSMNPHIHKVVKGNLYSLKECRESDTQLCKCIIDKFDKEKAHNGQWVFLGKDVVLVNLDGKVHSVNKDTIEFCKQFKCVCSVELEAEETSKPVKKPRSKVKSNTKSENVSNSDIELDSKPEGNSKTIPEPTKKVLVKPSTKSSENVSISDVELDEPTPIKIAKVTESSSSKRKNKKLLLFEDSEDSE